MYFPYCLVEKCKSDLPTDFDKRRLGLLADEHADSINLVGRRLSDLASDGYKGNLLTAESMLFGSESEELEEDDLNLEEPNDGQQKDDELDDELDFLELYDFLDARKMLREQEYTLKDEAKIWYEKLSEPDNSIKSFVYSSDSQLSELNALQNNFPNLREVIQLVTGSVRLCASNQLPISFPPLLIDGPPGIGKTQLFRILAELLELPLLNINMSHLHGRFELVGGHRAWRDSEPGILFKKLFNCASGNPILLFDEAELGDPSLYQPLYHVVEDDHFTDHFLDLEFDVSGANIVFITNDKNALPEALRSRLFEFDIQVPNFDEMRAIVRRIYRDVVDSSPMFAGFESELSDDCVELLCSEPMRVVRKIIYAALCKSSASTDKSCLEVADLDQSNCSSRGQMGFI